MIGAVCFAIAMLPAAICAWLVERWLRELRRDGWFPTDEGGRW